MELVGIKSDRHLWHCRCERGAGVRKEVGCGGEDEGVRVWGVLERRRRKGMLGRR
jgi:hypothetical protein